MENSVMAYASCLMSPVELKYDKCEKYLLAISWAIQHFAFLVGLSPIILHSLRTTLQFLLSNRVKDGQVSNAHLAHSALLLQEKDIAVKPVRIPSLLPHSLTVARRAP
ncbi:unnamed protein product [Caretta caretta]